MAKKNFRKTEPYENVTKPTVIIYTRNNSANRIIRFVCTSVNHRKKKKRLKHDHTLLYSKIKKKKKQYIYMEKIETYDDGWPFKSVRGR